MLTFFQLNCDAADCVAFGLDSGFDAGLNVDHVVCVDNSVNDNWFDDDSIDDDDNSVFDSVYDNSVYDSVYDNSVYDDSVDRVKQF